MNTADILKGSFNNLKNSKLRTILTMLGIIIGIGAVILISSIGSGQEALLQNTISKVGGNTVQLQINPQAKYNTNIKIVSGDYLTKNDIKMLKENPNIEYVSEFSQVQPWSIKSLNNTRIFPYKNLVNLMGVAPSYFNIISVKFLYGHNFYSNKSDGIIIGSELSKLLFHTTNSLGKKLTILIRSKQYKGLYSYIITGVVGSVFIGSNKLSKNWKQYAAYLSIGGIAKITGTAIKFSAFRIKPYKNTNLTTFTSQILNAVSKFHNSKQEIYIATPISTWYSSFSNYMKKNNLFMIFIAAISLLVDGIGIMNIMFVTVTERTREIGIRKAIGATNKDILTQFLLEAVILTVIGGALGIIFGYVGSYIVGNIIMHIPPVISIKMIILSTLISCGIGLIFGVYPAFKASKLEPVDALRYE